MNVFNRVVILLGLLALIACSASLMVAPGLVIAILADLFTTLDRSAQTGLIVAAVATGGALLLIGLALFWLELRWLSPPLLSVRQASGGKVKLAADSVADRLRHALVRVSGVVEVRPEVRSKGQMVSVTLDLVARPDIEIPSKTEELCRIVRDVIEAKMGLELVADPEIRLRFAPMAHPCTQPDQRELSVEESAETRAEPPGTDVGG